MLKLLLKDIAVQTCDNMSHTIIIIYTLSITKCMFFLCYLLYFNLLE